MINNFLLNLILQFILYFNINMKSINGNLLSKKNKNNLYNLKSLKKHNRDTDFIIFIADEFDKDIDIENLPSNVFIAKTALWLV